MDDLLEGLRRQVDLAAAPIDSTEVLTVVARRTDARERRTRVTRIVVASSLVVLLAAGAAAELLGRSQGSDVATGPSLGGDSCGAYEVTQQEISNGTSEHRVEQQCILDAFATGDAALLKVEWPTMEGSPVATYYLVTAEHEVAVITDGTDDAYSSNDVSTQLCTSLEPASRGTLLAASGCDRPVQCGSFDVGTDFEAVGGEPAVTGVRCLTDAFDDGRRATMSFSYTSDGTVLHWSYLVEGQDQVLVAARRRGPVEHVPPEWRFTIERCRVLDSDGAGAPVALSCTPLYPGRPNDENQPGGDRVVVTLEDAQGMTWEFDVYDSESGLCMDQRGAGGLCNPAPPQGEHAVSFAWGGVPGSRATLHGMVRRDVARIEIHLASGVVIHAFPGGEDSGFPVNFFAAELPVDAEVAAVVVFDAGGAQLDRAVPQATSNRLLDPRGD